MRTCKVGVAVAVFSLLAMTPVFAGELVVPCQNPIPGSYIIGLKSGVARTDSTVLSANPNLEQLGTDLALLHGGEVASYYRHGAVGFAMRLSESAARRLTRDPRVDFVEQDCPVYPSTTQSSAPWSLDRIDQSFLPLNNTYTYNENGSGVNIYVIDTGVSANSQLGSRLKTGRNWASGFPVTDTSDCWGTNGHGTAVAAMAAGSTYGVAKAANVYPLRVFNCSTGSTTWVRDAVDWMITNHIKPAVANMSFWFLPSTSGASSMETSIQAAFNAGIVMVASANNNDRDACLETPSRMADVITVGASDIQDQRAIFTFPQASNFGTCLDLWAPGKDTPSISRTGAAFNFGGTSAAAPLVSGAAALYLQSNPTHGPATVATYLTGQATPGVLVGSTLGTGSPNRLLFAKPAHACISWSCNVSTRTCTFDMNCSRMALGLGYFSLDFGDGSSSWGASKTVTHTYATSGAYTINLSLAPWYAQSESVNACVKVTSGTVSGCTTSGLKPWQ